MVLLEDIFSEAILGAFETAVQELEKDAYQLTNGNQQ